LSREIRKSAGAEMFTDIEGDMCGAAMRGADALPRSKTPSRMKGSCRNLGGLTPARSPSGPRAAPGSSEEHTPAMYGREKSDRRVVPMKLSNKVARAAAEGVEGRRPLEGSASRRRTRRTQGRRTCVPRRLLATLQNCMGCPTPNAAMLSPKRGARCGKAARRDLCGGRVATRVPTATIDLLRAKRVMVPRCCVAFMPTPPAHLMRAIHFLLGE